MKYAARGVSSVLLTATRGERGKTGEPPLCMPDELGEVRERELREAAGIIGFREIHLLDYRDRELADAKPDEIRRALVVLMRRVRPIVVLTFDPNGFNVHADHVAISRFTTDAIAAANDPRWHPEAGPPHRVQRLVWTPLFAPWEAVKLARLADHPSADFLVDVAPWLDGRVRALRAHRTQHQSIDRCFFQQPDLDRILATEIWRQAWGPPLESRPSGDLLEGLEVGLDLSSQT